MRLEHSSWCWRRCISGIWKMYRFCTWLTSSGWFRIGYWAVRTWPSIIFIHSGMGRWSILPKKTPCRTGARREWTYIARIFHRSTFMPSRPRPVSNSVGKRFSRSTQTLIGTRPMKRLTILCCQLWFGALVQGLLTDRAFSCHRRHRLSSNENLFRWKKRSQRSLVGERRLKKEKEHNRCWRKATEWNFYRLVFVTLQPTARMGKEGCTVDNHTWKSIRKNSLTTSTVLLDSSDSRWPGPWRYFLVRSERRIQVHCMRERDSLALFWSNEANKPTTSYMNSTAISRLSFLFDLISCVIVRWLSSRIQTGTVVFRSTSIGSCWFHIYGFRQRRKREETESNIRFSDLFVVITSTVFVLESRRTYSRSKRKRERERRWEKFDSSVGHMITDGDDTRRLLGVFIGIRARQVSQNKRRYIGVGWYMKRKRNGVPLAKIECNARMKNKDMSSNDRLLSPLDSLSWISSPSANSFTSDVSLLTSTRRTFIILRRRWAKQNRWSSYE